MALKRTYLAPDANPKILLAANILNLKLFSCTLKISVISFFNCHARANEGFILSGFGLQF